jgi:hypothetical protein
MDNLEIYNRVRAVPEEAKKRIGGGKLNGMTDINPMWRIKILTEVFGPCGTGWYPIIDRQWTEQGADGEVLAFCTIRLVVRGKDGGWMDISGTGGSKLIQLEKGKLVSNDEAYKMAYTDAISVAAKCLGVGADVYWDKDRTKYSAPQQEPPQQAERPVVCSRCGKAIQGQVNRKTGQAFTPAQVAKTCGGLCPDCYRESKAVK